MSNQKIIVTEEPVTNPWVLLDAEKSLDSICKVLQSVSQSQQETALSLQRLLSGLNDKIDRVESKIDRVQTKMDRLDKRLKNVENHIIDKDAREQNRRLRQRDAFAFQPSKTGTGIP
jgi:uncharacterized coiled-coil protein SlyX